MTRLRDADGVQGKIDAFKIDPRTLEVDPDYNIRDLDAPDERETLDWLKQSIRTNGVQEALRVRMDGERCLIVRGHRRHRAVMELIAEGVEIKNVLCLQEPQGTTELERDLDLVLSNTQERPKPIQFANLIYRIINVHGLTEDECAERLSRPVETIRRHLELRAAPEPVKEMVRRNEVSATTAVREVRRNGSRAIETLTQAKREAEAAGKTKVTPARLKTIAPAPVAAPAEPPAQPDPVSAPDKSILQEMIDALRPVAKSALRFALSNHADDTMVPMAEISIRDLRTVFELWSKVTGGQQP